MNARTLLRQQQTVKRRRRWLLALLCLVAAGWAYNPNGSLWHRTGEALSGGFASARHWVVGKAQRALSASNTEPEAQKIASAAPIAKRVDVGGGRQRLIKWPAREVQCMALTIYHEAAGDGLDAQLAIAQVALNRMRAPGKDGRKASSGSKSICGIVYKGLNQPLGCLFKQTCRRIGAIPDAGQAWSDALATAGKVLASGVDPAPAFKIATHFRDRTDAPAWASGLYEVATIGRFVFLTSEPTHDMIAKLARENKPEAAVGGRDAADDDDRPRRSASRVAEQKRASPKPDLSKIFER